MKHGLPLMLAALLALPGCTEPAGTVYAQPLSKARQILATTGLPPFVFGTAAPASRVLLDGASDIIWIVRADDAEAVRFVATLSDAGQGATRVRLRIEGATGGRLGDVEQRLAKYPTIRKLYLTAMQERIASALEQRPFDMARIYPAMGVATIANIGSIMAQFDRAAAQHKRRSRANIEKAYRDEAAGTDY